MRVCQRDSVEGGAAQWGDTVARERVASVGRERNGRVGRAGRGCTSGWESGEHTVQSTAHGAHTAQRVNGAHGTGHKAQGTGGCLSGRRGGCLVSLIRRVQSKLHERSARCVGGGSLGVPEQYTDILLNEFANPALPSTFAWVVPSGGLGPSFGSRALAGCTGSIGSVPGGKVKERLDFRILRGF